LNSGSTLKLELTKTSLVTKPTTTIVHPTQTQSILKLSQNSDSRVKIEDLTINEDVFINNFRSSLIDVNQENDFMKLLDKTVKNNLSSLIELPQDSILQLEPLSLTN